MERKQDRRDPMEKGQTMTDENKREVLLGVFLLLGLVCSPSMFLVPLVLHPWTTMYFEY
jgi:hypothetical protein